MTLMILGFLYQPRAATQASYPTLRNRCTLHVLITQAADEV
jgi:hypothetical protein